jgi:transposase, IS5 family
MYRTDSQPELPDFYLPFGGKLDPENRWVKLAQAIPWHLIEEDYRSNFATSGMGAPAKESRIALGALIIKERLGVTDEETVDQIRENPYLQYFLGLHEYLRDDLFDPSMMVHFRKRISAEALEKVNIAIIRKARKQDDPSDDPPSSPPSETPPPSKGSDAPPADSSTAAPNGKLLIDATCAPADITYPTDLKLLNDAREKTERIIDKLHAAMPGKPRKPRTYRKKARRDFLDVALSKKPKGSKIRTAIGKQLRYIKRNLGHIHRMLDNGASLSDLTAYWHKCLMVIHTVYDQQLGMYRDRSHRCDDRIVSISQPHVRPIVRGKISQRVEFGAKISASHVDGFILLDRFSWDAYNETVDLSEQAEAFRQRFGHYPSSIHADKIYQTRANRAWCKERDIRLSGKPLGRPREMTKEEKKRQRQDETDRIPIEGKFGNAKRKGTLQRVMAKLAVTSRTVVTIGLIALNLDALLRILRAFIQSWRASQALMKIKHRVEHCTCPLPRGFRVSADAWRAAA